MQPFNYCVLIMLISQHVHRTNAGDGSFSASADALQKLVDHEEIQRAARGERNDEGWVGRKRKRERFETPVDRLVKRATVSVIQSHYIHRIAS